MSEFPKDEPPPSYEQGTYEQGAGMQSTGSFEEDVRESGEHDKIDKSTPSAEAARKDIEYIFAPPKNSVSLSRSRGGGEGSGAFSSGFGGVTQGESSYKSQKINRFVNKIKEARILKSPDYEVRSVDNNDIRRLVEIDMERYDNAYAENPAEAERVEEMMRERVANAREWMWVVEMDGEVEGFITGQPTKLNVDEFTSWEKSTDNGKLTNTYDPSGENLYVVNLTAMRKASKINAHFRLIGALGEKVIAEGVDKVIFSSRMPGFKQWIEEQNINVHEKTSEELDELARQYSNFTTEIDGKTALYDKQLRMYAESGFKLKRLVRNGFEDPDSLNYGVVCEVPNPVPAKYRSKPTNFLGAKIFRFASKNPQLLDKVV